MRGGPARIGHSVADPRHQSHHSRDHPTVLMVEPCGRVFKWSPVTPQPDLPPQPLVRFELCISESGGKQTECGSNRVWCSGSSWGIRGQETKRRADVHVKFSENSVDRAVRRRQARLASDHPPTLEQKGARSLFSKGIPTFE